MATPTFLRHRLKISTYKVILSSSDDKSFVSAPRHTSEDLSFTVVISSRSFLAEMGFRLRKSEMTRVLVDA